MPTREMFPSKYLQAEDLPRNQNTIVTIERVYPGQARAQHGGDAEIKWFIKFHEFRRPMGLWRSTAQSIAEVLNTDNTDAWVGQQVAIYPSTYISFGESKPCINVDKWRPAQTQPGAMVTTAAKGRLSHLLLANDNRVIPLTHVQRFMALCKEKGRDFDGFLYWLKVNAPNGYEAVYGKDLPAIPGSVTGLMKAFLDELNSPPQTQAAGAPAESVDVSTGEVKFSPPPDGQTPELPEEDIPF